MQRIKNFIKKHPIITGIGVVILLAAILINIFLKEGGKELTPTTPEVTALSSPSVYPSGKTQGWDGTRNTISLLFDEDVDLSTLKVNSEPSMEFNSYIAKDVNHQVSLYPQTNWEAGKTYKITVSKGLMNKDHTKELKEDVTFDLTITKIEIPVPNRPI